MKKYRELVEQMQGINDQINREQDAEKKSALIAQFENVQREAGIAREAEKAEQLKMQREQMMKGEKKDVSKIFREMVKNARETGRGEWVIGREVSLATTYTTTGEGDAAVTTANGNSIEEAGAIPQNIEALLPELKNKIVYGQLGIPVATGVKGDIIWPVLASGVTATVENENAQVGDSSLDFDKVNAVQQRLSVSCAVSNQALDNAAFDLYGTVVNALTDGVAKVINNAVISPTAVATNFAGGFNKALHNVKFAAATPTYAELLSLKGKVAKENVEIIGGAYVMDEEMYATLEATPITTGDSKMIITDGKIGAYPVIATNTMATGKVGFGVFAYEALNNHGESRLIVDPYSAARKNQTVFTLNSVWSLSVLRTAAFCLGGQSLTAK